MRPFVLAALFGWAGTHAASAQSAPTAAPRDAVDSMAVAGGRFYFDNAINGYGKAKILGPDGKTHYVFIPINVNGFAKLLPFYRREEDLHRFGAQPFSINVDKVKSIQLNSLYLEHMVVKGKHKHILAARLAEGAVEVFNYTEIVDTGLMVAYPERSWYLRRQGELVEVSRRDFVAQMTAYFHDDAQLVALINAGKLHYRDTLTLARLYNRRKTTAAPGPTGAN